MMKNIITSPYRKLKIFLILPVFAIVLYAFAKPDYRYDTGKITGNNEPVAAQERTVKGSVVQAENNKPLEGAAIVVLGTTSGTVSGADGSFTIGNIPEGGALAVTYVGYKSTVIKPVFTSNMKVPMDLDTINSERFTDPMAPPPPPPPPPLSSGESNVEVLPLPEKLGTSTNPKGEEGVFIVVEELPQFPGGNAAMNSWIIENMKYPGEAVKRKIEGKVYVTFIITSTGKIKHVDVQHPVNPLLDDEAKRIISTMPDWKPGTQSGKAVDVRYKVPVEFKLKQ